MLNGTVFIVDDDAAVLRSLSAVLAAEDFEVKTFTSAESFLESCDEQASGCIVLDVRMPGLDGLQAQEELARRRITMPVIFLTGHGDVPMSVRAMKGGAFDFLQKPVAADTLIARVYSALREDLLQQKKRAEVEAARERLSRLTTREVNVLTLLLQGKANKIVARELNISPRTVEIHRKNILEKTETKNLVELGQLYHLADQA